MELFYLSPIIAIGIACILAIVIDPLTGSNYRIGYIFSLIGLFTTGFVSALTLNFDPSQFSSLSQLPISQGMISFGNYSSFLDIIFCVAGILTILAAKPYFNREHWETTEFYTLVLYAVSGMIVIAHANHMLMLFIGIEIMSITFYVLAGYFRNTIKSVEASLKYFLLGSFATGFLLYGMSLIYGATGTMYFSNFLSTNSISQAISTGALNNQAFLTIGFGLIIIGLSFKAAAFPFHQWAPDVYTGAPTVVTAFMSTAGKAAAMISFIIVIKAILPENVIDSSMIELSEKTRTVIAVISAITMLIGNITALVQKNIKRMLAYSSVAHAGYLLMGIVANNATGWEGILFYTTSYMLMQIGSFIILSILERGTDKFQNLEDYSGLYKKHPFLAATMSIFLFSLAGIPPFAGFFGKYQLFTAAIQSGFTWLTLVAVVSSIISVYFYIGLIVYMYFKEPNEIELEADYGASKIAVIFSTLAVIIIGVYPPILNNLISRII
jgi:NADH-quinone oxidoreductase subunit N